MAGRGLPKEHFYKTFIKIQEQNRIERNLFNSSSPFGLWGYMFKTISGHYRTVQAMLNHFINSNSIRNKQTHNFNNDSKTKHMHNIYVILQLDFHLSICIIREAPWSSGKSGSVMVQKVTEKLEFKAGLR